MNYEQRVLDGNGVIQIGVEEGVPVTRDADAAAKVWRERGKAGRSSGERELIDAWHCEVIAVVVTIVMRR